MFHRILVLAAVLALLAVSLTAGPALAGKGGKGGNGGNGGLTTATMTVSPNPAPLGTAVTISGSGFKPGPVNVMVDLRLPCDTLTVDSAGNFSYVYSRPLDPGFHSVIATQEGRKGWELVANTTFTVEP